MATKRIPRPRDPIALAKLIGDIATGQRSDPMKNADDGRKKTGKKETAGQPYKVNPKSGQN